MRLVWRSCDEWQTGLLEQGVQTGDDQQFFLSPSAHEGLIVKTVIIFYDSHTNIKAYTPKYGTRHSTIDTPVYSSWEVFRHSQCSTWLQSHTHLSAGHRAKGVGWPHDGLGVHHSGRIHHPHRAHLWRLRVKKQTADIIQVFVKTKNNQRFSRWNPHYRRT